MIQPRIQSIILHLDNLEALKCLSATSMGNLMFALMNYAACGEMPQFKNRALMAVFHLLRAALDRDVAKYQTRCSGSSAKTSASKTMGNCNDGIVMTNSPHTPLNNNNNNNNNYNNNNHNSPINHDDDESVGEEMKMEGGLEKEKEVMTEKEEHDEMTASMETPTGKAAAAADQHAATPDSTAEDLTFERAYSLYDKPAGDSVLAQSVWDALKDDERRAAIEYIKSYVELRPYKQYRRKFCNFLKQRTWEREPLTDCRPAAVAPPAANGNVDSVSCQADSVDDSPQHSIDNHSNDSHSIDSHSIDSHSIDSHSIDNHSIDNHSIDSHSIDNHGNDNRSNDSHERQVARGESQIEYVRRVFAQHGYDYDALLAYK